MEPSDVDGDSAPDLGTPGLCAEWIVQPGSRRPMSGPIVREITMSMDGGGERPFRVGSFHYRPTAYESQVGSLRLSASTRLVVL